MQDKVIDIILKINKKFFFKKTHPFNTTKKGVLNLNYSDFEYNHTKGLLEMYSKVIDLNFFNNKKILEIGCGAGGKSVYVAEKYGSKVVGLDINDIFLDQARVKAREHNVEDLTEFVNMSALATDFDDESFDVILMSDVMEHIPDTEKLLDEMYRILKKDGIILFDFAPYYHYFGHHLWDTIQIPWIHLFFTDKFLIKLYKKSVEGLVDGDARIKLRIGRKPHPKFSPLFKPHPNPLLSGEGMYVECFDYLNKIRRKDFENIVGRFFIKNNIEQSKINYYMLKNMNFLSKIPGLREIFIKHIVGYIKK